MKSGGVAIVDVLTKERRDVRGSIPIDGNIPTTHGNLASRYVRRASIRNLSLLAACEAISSLPTISQSQRGNLIRTLAWCHQGVTYSLKSLMEALSPRTRVKRYIELPRYQPIEAWKLDTASHASAVDIFYIESSDVLTNLLAMGNGYITVNWYRPSQVPLTSRRSFVKTST